MRSGYKRVWAIKVVVRFIISFLVFRVAAQYVIISHTSFPYAIVLASMSTMWAERLLLCWRDNITRALISILGEELSCVDSATVGYVPITVGDGLPHLTLNRSVLKNKCVSMNRVTPTVTSSTKVGLLRERDRRHSGRAPRANFFMANSIAARIFVFHTHTFIFQV